VLRGHEGAGRLWGMDTSQLKNRNENPWYILMTLHGEQEGDQIDRDKAEANRKAWNSWVCQGMDTKSLIKAITDTGIDRSETRLDAAGLGALTKRFQDVWKERNGNSVVVPDLPDPGDAAEMDRIVFSKKVDLERTIFRTTNFSSSTFEETASFSGAAFGNLSNFNGTTFCTKTNFNGATFGKTTEFTGVTFNEAVSFSSAAFGELTYFDDVTFDNDTSFSRATFGENAYFTYANFAEKTNFVLALFGEMASFEGATFGGAIYFDQATFGDKTSFDGTKFNTFVSFQNAKIAGDISFKGRADSRDLAKPAAHFAATTRFSEADFSGRVNFYQRRFGPYDGETKDLSFANAIFDGPVSFEEAAFPHVLPVLSNTTLPQSTKVSVDPEKWPDLPGPFAWIGAVRPKGWEKIEQVKASAASLRHAMARQMLPEEEHFFFRYEMNAAALMGGFWQRFPYGIFALISDFGHSILRPSLWLLGVVLVGWVLYTYQFAADAVLRDGAKTTGEALALSIANTFSFFGFQRLYFGVDYINALPTWMRVAGAVQTVFGFVFLFFLGLGLRTRFRLR